MSKEKPYQNNTVTWQAYIVMQVEMDCVSSGKFPNGKKMTKKDFEESNEQIKACRAVLIQYGIEPPQQYQLSLF